MKSHSTDCSNGLEERVYFEQNKYSKSFGNATIETVNHNLQERNKSVYKSYDNLSTDDYDWTNRAHALSNPTGPVRVPLCFPSTNPRYVDPQSYHVVSNKPCALFEEKLKEIRSNICDFRDKQNRFEKKKHLSNSATWEGSLKHDQFAHSSSIIMNKSVNCDEPPKYNDADIAISNRHPIAAALSNITDLMEDTDGARATVHYKPKRSIPLEEMTVDEILALIQWKKDIPNEKYFQLTLSKKVSRSTISDQICERNRRFVPKIIELTKKPVGVFVLNDSKSSGIACKKIIQASNGEDTENTFSSSIGIPTSDTQMTWKGDSSIVRPDTAEEIHNSIPFNRRILTSARKSSVNPQSGDVGTITAIAARPFSAKNVELNRDVGRSQRLLAHALLQKKVQEEACIKSIYAGKEGVIMTPPAVDDDTVARLQRSADGLERYTRPPVVFTLSREGMLSNVHFRSLEPIKRRGSREVRGSSAMDAPAVFSYQKTQLTRMETSASLAEPISTSSSSFPNRRDYGKPLNMASMETQLAEKYALMTVFDSCGGNRWLRSDNWGTTASLKEWYGVGVNMEGYVLELNLSKNNLTGAFPDSLHGLIKLEVLIMDDNELEGELPEFSLCKILNLQVLSARNNKLSGNIPFFGLADLENLRELWLSENDFMGCIPGHIDKLSKLTHLCVYRNQLTGTIPNEICALRKLIFLSLSNNKLSGPIPSNIIELDKLQTLSVYNNQLTGTVPNWLETLPDLRVLELFNNKFEGHVPQSLEDLQRSILALKQKFDKVPHILKGNRITPEVMNSVK